MTFVKLCNIIVIICLALTCSACTGPFGFVIGPEGTHHAYNKRKVIEKLTENDRAALQSLLDEVAK